jgi:adenylate cyclase
MERRLAAILAVDVVGYSRLMEQDEAGTFETLRAHRKDLFEPEIAKHHGRIFKLMGDGLLAEFGSAVDTVECAVALQRSMVERNAAVEKERRVEVRIGINLGEVIVEGEDRYGEGVNVAARLQQLAQPGGICVSDKVVKEVEKKLAFRFESMGEQKVKNIAEPLRVYRVHLERKEEGRKVRPPQKSFGRWRWPAATVLALLIVAAAGTWFVSTREDPIEGPPLPDKPSIAVLPFANMSDDPKQEYFADGITDDLITDLSKVSGLFIIARNSTAKYKGQPVTIGEVSKTLGVRYVLEGTVQRAGEQVRINARLIDAVSGGDVWADRFNGSLDDVFSLQDNVTRSIAHALAVQLTPDQEQLIRQKETDVPTAYDAFLEGWAHFVHSTSDEYAKAIPYFEEAIRLDPNYGRPYAALALVYWHSWWEEENLKETIGLSTRQTIEKAYGYLKEAKKHPSSLSYQASGLTQSYNGAFLAAYDDFKQAIALDPSDSRSYADMAGALVFEGRPGEAIPFVTTAMRIDPNYPPSYSFILGLAQFGLDQFEEAAKSFENATRRNPRYSQAFLLLGATYGHLNRQAEGKAAIATCNSLLAQDGHAPLTIAAAMGAYRRNFMQPKDTERLAQGLRQAGVPDF